jgi:hypothetical protein
MPTTPAADRLRRRADALAGLAGRMADSELHVVHLSAGGDTWVGPSPQACLDDLRARRALMVRHSDDLAAEARRFRRLADELDASAATAAGVS